MRGWLLMGVSGLLVVTLSGAAYGADPVHIRQLLSTGSCPG